MAGIRTENKIYEVGIYCRLSKDDGTDNESASIATQKSILTDYVKRQGWHLAKTYVDDGYSGTNFQRPSFQNMIKDIENGLINCVITKDLSRLGRNYLDCGLYLEVFFPEHNVRYRERNRRACIELSAKNDRLISNSGRDASSGRATKMRRWIFTVTSPRVHSMPTFTSWWSESRNSSHRS